MLPEFHGKSRRASRRWGAVDKAIAGLAGLAALAIFVTHVMHSMEVNREHTKRQASLSKLQQEVELNLLSLAHAKGSLNSAEDMLTRDKTEASSAKGQLDNAYEKCESMRAELDADYERQLMDRTYDWKEDIFSKIKLKEDSLEEQRSFWETQLKPMREQTASLNNQLLSHRTDLAKTEVSRVMHRVLGISSEAEEAAFFDRVSSQTFSEPFTLTKSVAARLNNHRGLWSLSPLGEKKVLGLVSEQLMAELPEEDVIGSRFPRSGKWNKCAVVGSSGVLKKYRQGKEIDLHDAVWRLDNAPVEGFEEHVGSHTTIRVVSDSAFVETRMRPSREMLLQIVDSKESMEEFVRFKTEQRRDAINVVMLSPEFMQHLSKFMLRSAPQGFYTLALAMHKCRTVDVYGFSPTWRDHFPYRYWDSFEPEPNLYHQQGPLRDVEGVDFVLLAELARLSSLSGSAGAPEGPRQHGPTARIHEPCLTLYSAFSACSDSDSEGAEAAREAACGAVGVSESAVCLPRIPLPQPRPGFCADPHHSRVPANCFRRCPGKPGTTGEAQCAGTGTVGPACDEVNVSPEEGSLEGLTCP